MGYPTDPNLFIRLKMKRKFSRTKGNRNNFLKVSLSCCQCQNLSFVMKKKVSNLVITNAVKLISKYYLLCLFVKNCEKEVAELKNTESFPFTTPIHWWFWAWRIEHVVNAINCVHCPPMQYALCSVCVFRKLTFSQQKSEDTFFESALKIKQIISWQK